MREVFEVSCTVGPHLSGRDTFRFTGHPPRSAINARSNAHAHYRLDFELSESARSLEWPL